MVVVAEDTAEMYQLRAVKKNKCRTKPASGVLMSVELHYQVLATSVSDIECKSGCPGYYWNSFHPEERASL